MYNGLYGLNTAVKDAYTGTAVKFDGNNAPIYKDGATTYTFSHWKVVEGNDVAVGTIEDGTELNKVVLKGDVTFQAVYKVKDATKYAVKFYDGNGNVIDDASNKSDYSFRDSVILPSTEPTKAQDDRYVYTFIGWANNVGENFYAVDKDNKDASGAVISYASKDAAEFTVRDNASYVPVFRMTDREYNVTFNYKVDGGKTETVTVGGYKWEDTLKWPEGVKDNYTSGGYRYTITGWKLGDAITGDALENITVNGNIKVTAAYGAGEPAKYTINFYDRDGKLVNEGSNIYEHNKPVTVPSVGDGEGFAIPYTIETARTRYTFSGWSPDVKTNATADAEYRAQYSKKDYANIYFYNYDGTPIYNLNGKENSLFVGELIPAYDGATPEKEEDVVGTYKFVGWKDAYGNVVVPGTDKFIADIHLYAQFETVHKEYTVKFLNDDGTVVSEKKYHYATQIEAPAENPTKEADETYEYSFKAWTPEVSAVCYGDATYTATYRRAYKTYTVTWLDDAKQPYSVINYRFNAKINQAVIKEPVSYEEAREGYTWSFAYWVQCDADGNDILVNGKQVTYTRGMKMPAEALYFYPVFTEVADPITVTFYQENGTTVIGTTEVPYDGKLADYAGAFEKDASKKPTAQKHYKIVAWVELNADIENKELDEIKAEYENAVIQKSISVKPVYEAENHSLNEYDVKKYPTCAEPGLANIGCADTECNYVAENVVIDVLADTDVPGGQIYVGEDKWSSAVAVDFENEEV